MAVYKEPLLQLHHARRLAGGELLRRLRRHLPRSGRLFPCGDLNGFRRPVPYHRRPHGRKNGRRAPDCLRPAGKRQHLWRRGTAAGMYRLCNENLAPQVPCHCYLLRSRGHRRRRGAGSGRCGNRVSHSRSLRTLRRISGGRIFGRLFPDRKADHGTVHQTAAPGSRHGPAVRRPDGTLRPVCPGSETPAVRFRATGKMAVSRLRPLCPVERPFFCFPSHPPQLCGADPGRSGKNGGGVGREVWHALCSRCVSGGLAEHLRMAPQNCATAAG